MIFGLLRARLEETWRIPLHADCSLREVQGLLSEIGGVREIHSADLVDVYSRETRRGEALIFLRTVCTQS